MGTSRSKLIEGLKSNINHKINEISIDDLIDQNVLNKEFTNSLFKEFLKEELTEEEDEEMTLFRYLEHFKKDVLVNFTNPSVGKEIVNMSSNHGKLNFIYFSL
jgi:uncharacterized protein YnzC (UPF0291/DUF896 family)